MKKRFQNTTDRIDQSYLVECPECKKESIVAKDKDNVVTLHCYNCMYKANLDEFIRYKAVVKRNCPQCGEIIYHSQDNFKNPPDELEVLCTNCNFKAAYIPSISNYSSSPDIKGLKGDPYFGFPLWLQTEVKGNLFWAFNRDFLNEIKNFVEADLRENKTRYHMTMTSRLPEFIKTAKNRDAVLKAIERMLMK